MHIPVLKKEVIEYLDIKPNQNFVDATLGNGGHTFEILEKNGPQGKVLGIDQDARQIENTKEILDSKYKDRLVFSCDNFNNLKKIVEENKFKNISGIILDLGFSSWHLEGSGRGFSFLKDEPLDMRLSTSGELTAFEILNYWSYQDIENILQEYGQEKFFKKITNKIIEQRKVKPISSTVQLVNLIEEAIPYRQGKIHPATKTFQALRIAVNNELNNLSKVLPLALDILECGGKIIVISFHSLEDKIVKEFFKEEIKKDNLKLINKKPVGPSKEEIKINPRSRSAKLRAAIKLCHK